MSNDKMTNREELERLNATLKKSNAQIEKLAQQLGLKGIEDDQPTGQSSVVEDAIAQWVQRKLEDDQKKNK